MKRQTWYRGAILTLLFSQTILLNSCKQSDENNDEDIFMDQADEYNDQEKADKYNDQKTSEFTNDAGENASLVFIPEVGF
jgi:hypothetical protein